MPDDGSACPVCGRTDNDSGMFVWIIAGDSPEPFCPGDCVNSLLDQLRAEGLQQQADELALSISQQIAGGWRDNIRLLEDPGG